MIYDKCPLMLLDNKFTIIINRIQRQYTMYYLFLVDEIMNLKPQSNQWKVMFWEEFNCLGNKVITLSRDQWFIHLIFVSSWWCILCFYQGLLCCRTYTTARTDMNASLFTSCPSSVAPWCWTNASAAPCGYQTLQVTCVNPITSLPR
jgi:hypothetical protein